MSRSNSKEAAEQVGPLSLPPSPASQALEGSASQDGQELAHASWGRPRLEFLPR